MDYFRIVSLVLMGFYSRLVECQSTQLVPGKGKLKELHGEFCQHEVFEGRCDEHHVLFITKAQYGRIRLGRCVKTDFGFVGCFDEVTDVLDKKCSGRHSCDITVVDPNFDNRRPCNEEFKNHLEVWYTCVPVNYPLAGSCDIHLKTKAFLTQSEKKSPAEPPGATTENYRAGTGLVVSEAEGYLPSSISEDTGCGTDVTPWVITVSKGQRLRISIYDFNVQSAKTHQNPQPQNSLICYKYGLLLEPHHRKSIDICAGSQREMLTYDSKGETIHLSISRPGHSYMVKYEAIGCPDIPSNDVMWFRREDSTLDVGCYATDQEWHLSCRDTYWVGALGNCTGKKGEVAPSSVGADTEFSLPPGVMIGVISVVAVCISLAIVIVGLICIKRAKHLTHKDVSSAGEDSNLHNAMQLNVCGSKVATQGDYAIKLNEETYSHIFVPNQDCPLHSGIYGCKQHISPRHAYGVLHPLEPTIHEHEQLMHPPMLHNTQGDISMDTLQKGEYYQLKTSSISGNTAEEQQHQQNGVTLTPDHRLSPQHLSNQINNQTVHQPDLL